MMKFKIPFVDREGHKIGCDSFMGAIGFSECYRGVIDEEDELVVAIRKSLTSQPLDEQERALVRSFFCAFLSAHSAKPWAVVDQSVELPQTVRFLEQVGFLDRTVNAVGSGLVNVALAVALFDLTWDLSVASEEPLAVAGTLATFDAALLLLPNSLFMKMGETFGQPGDPLPRSKFDAESVFALVRLCKLRSCIHELDLTDDVKQRLLAILDRRAFTLFLANSRQVEGLVISGSSEASAAVAAHAALALGLSQSPDVESILEVWQRGISSLSDAERIAESSRTLESIQVILRNDVSAIEAQVSRQLLSSSTTEALDLAVVPLKVSFQLMGFVANSLATVAPEGHFKAAFEAANQGAEFARSTTDATPDAFAKTIDMGVSAEVWARNVVSKFWRKADEKSSPPEHG